MAGIKDKHRRGKERASCKEQEDRQLARVGGSEGTGGGEQYARPKKQEVAISRPCSLQAQPY